MISQHEVMERSKRKQKVGKVNNYKHNFATAIKAEEKWKFLFREKYSTKSVSVKNHIV